MGDIWLALTGIGTLALAGATFYLGWQSRAATRLGRDQARLLAKQAGFDDPSVWVVPLDTDEARSERGIARLRASHRDAYAGSSSSVSSGHGR